MLYLALSRFIQSCTSIRNPANNNNNKTNKRQQQQQKQPTNQQQGNIHM